MRLAWLCVVSEVRERGLLLSELGAGHKRESLAADDIQYSQYLQPLLFRCFPRGCRRSIAVVHGYLLLYGRCF